MPDLLLEIFSEEIPARMQRRAAEDLRKLVTDALVARGWEVSHIGSDGRVARHELTEFALVGEAGRVRYPASGWEQLGLGSGKSLVPHS